MSRAKAIKEHAVVLTGRAAVIITSVSILIAMGMLELMTDPPSLWPDALWVNNHRPHVMVAMLALSTAIGASVPGLRLRHTRWLIFAIWAFAIAVLAIVFGDRVETIGRVLINHYVL